ncbi:hypothetical protein K0F19_07550 [Bacteroides fragilis]|nr:hypothetical protein [Bacteroides fragilis]
MKANKIVFLYQPCMVIVCESIEFPNSIDPETNDLREYARIVRFSYETKFFPYFEFIPAGSIEWTKHADMLSKEQRDSIEKCSQRLREEDKERIDYFNKLKEASIKSHNQHNNKQ